MSRLTFNNPNDNVGMGDRILALWQGSGYYLFITTTNGNANFYVNGGIPHPEDIEGLWCYAYFSYSKVA